MAILFYLVIHRLDLIIHRLGFILVSKWAYIYIVKNNNNIQIEHDHRSLLLWFAATYFIFGPILTFLRDFRAPWHSLTDIDGYSLIFIFSSLIGFFLFMYITYQAFYRYYPDHKIKLILGMLCALWIPIIIRYSLDQKLYLWLFGVTNYNAGTTFDYYYTDNTYFAVYYIPSGILYYFFRRMKALQTAKVEAEKLRAEAEVVHLRSQINPHFLFNSLNNIYSLAFDKSDHILGAIEGLSDLLRYALYEKSVTVPFSLEWQKIEQLIKLEKMRLADPVAFDINISDEVNAVAIPPVILLPLIENLFKHGDLQDATAPPMIKASVVDQKLIFDIENKISTMRQKDGQNGIGLENIKKRLTHLFGDKADLKVSSIDHIFTAQLSIPIS